MNRTQQQQIVIIGAGYGGLMTALRLVGQTKGQPCQITLVNREAHFTQRIRLHQAAAQQPIPAWYYPTFLRGTGITFIQATVLAIHPDSQEIELESAAGWDKLGYDRLVYALGSGVDVERVPGVKQQALSLSNAASAQAAAQHLSALADGGGHLVVVGAGLTGLEAVTELAERYPTLRVQLVTSGHVGADQAPNGQAHLLASLERLGIEISENSPIQRAEAGRLIRTDGSSLPFDALLWAGSFAVAPLAAQAGLKTNPQGRILVDEGLRSLSHPTIIALGDSAIREGSAIPFRMSCQAAMPMGAYVGDQLAAWVQGRAFDAPFNMAYSLHCISLGRSNGLINFTTPDDQPTGRILTGYRAALVKEAVVRFAHTSLRLSRSWPRLYHWPKAPSAALEQGLAYGHAR
jgi:NADH dehydrogenase FAD-containing subunit